MPNPKDPKSYVGTGIAYPQGELRTNENPYAFQTSGITSSPAFTGYDPTGGAGRGTFALGTQLKRLDTGETITVRDPKESFNLNYVQLAGQPVAGQPAIPAQQTNLPTPPQTVAMPATGVGMAGALPLANLQQTLGQLQQTNLANLTPQQRQQLGGSLQGLNQSLQRYRQTFQQGAPAGTDIDSAASARAGVQTALPSAPTAAQPTTVDYLSMTAPQDPFLTELMTTWRESMNDINQRQSLTQTYQQLLKDSGIQALDTEMMNMKNVIEGTEDDIRNEVTKAGGFATDSQVLALTNSRNKQLIKNYNTLLETRNSKEQYLNTMIGLEQADRQEANSRFDRMMNFGFQAMQYQQRMQDNTRASNQKLLDNFGPQGVLAAIGNDPYGLRYFEQSLGLGSGGLQRLATLPTPVEKEKLPTDLQTFSILYPQYEAGTPEFATKYDQFVAQQATLKRGPEKPTTVDGEISPTILYYSQLLSEGKISLANVPQGIRNAVVAYNQGNIAKPLSDVAIKEITQTQGAIQNLESLRDIVKSNLQFIGPISGLQRFNPWSKARQVQADVNRVRQIVGKALEGGVLRKEDEEKYKQILATLADTPETALYKIDALISQLGRDVDNYKKTQAESGRFIPETSSKTLTPEELRSKYNY